MFKEKRFIFQERRDPTPDPDFANLTISDDADIFGVNKKIETREAESAKKKAEAPTQGQESSKVPFEDIERYTDEKYNQVAKTVNDNILPKFQAAQDLYDKIPKSFEANTEGELTSDQKEHPFEKYKRAAKQFSESNIFLELDPESEDVIITKNVKSMSPEDFSKAKEDFDTAFVYLTDLKKAYDKDIKSYAKTIDDKDADETIALLDK
jgi:hypothetical protein